MAAGLAAAGAVSIVGSLMEGQDQANAFDDQAHELRNNARAEREVGRFNVMRQQIVANKKLGTMSAEYAASGVSQESGSVLDVIGASHANSELDRLSILHGSEMRARSMETRANIAEHSASNALRASYFGALGSAFKTGASVAGAGGGGSPSKAPAGDYGTAGGSYGAGGYGRDEEYA